MFFIESLQVSPRRSLFFQTPCAITIITLNIECFPSRRNET
ncbi:hypothetical protein HMPREF0239_02866 [Clostridium sp. ATCC BAA-442]|uniref:Uncharacterized protein n=1 Tax=Flavonifractor plautii ATCC 29863 TaxID=411475 RepID=G9YKR5_FLAPL|nr:hypothetical protein HMPREF0372_00075 [Flavonifractor plautii ATCC 29863]ERI73520.1 hypothetical protein HMPREF0239_02866 [Clostridium sp. ATCC BAA-442]